MVRNVKVGIYFSFILAVMSNVCFAAPSVESGKAIYDTKCIACHELLAGNRIGPDLAGVTQRREKEWMKGFIQHPAEFFEKGDPIATELLEQYKVPMADLGLTGDDVESVLLYLESKDAEAELAP